MTDPKTKIVATIGPASASAEVLRDLLHAGVDVCRLNFSHGSYDFYAEVIGTIRSLSKELGIHTAILADLQGPKMRVGEMENGGIDLPDDSELVISTDPVKGRPGLVSTTYTQFPQDVKPGELVLLDDGKLRLEVTATDGRSTVTTRVINGGRLTGNKGLNLPNTRISLPCLTDKDKEDLTFALSHDVDWVGLSFVRSARDIIELKHIIRAQNKHARVVAKIEKPEALKEIDDIIREADALMVARGDLGVEIPMEKVPLIQKDLIRRCLAMHRPVIVATQMMESMITSFTPTRAEVNDVANAVLDHADAVMLSAETSVGKYPVEVVRTMNRILVEMETSDGMFNVPNPPLEENQRTISDAISIAAVRMTEAMPVKAIVTMTHSGYTAFKISSMRPRANIYAFTSNPAILCMLNLVWGVRAHYYDKTVSTDHTIADIKHILRNKKFVQQGELVINIASMPIAEKGMANMLKVSPA
ncbi:MAG: pyruvate kinase [Flavobacteriales bacterium]|jgi:pyruvate kinase|nr:pyruvate kinase [Flavobacteriales bacterium]MBK6753714.1 pyruvate kinase [Flavobacteriales bacterium]MBK7085501.1 pyruvate kinase [Flavobacteriales bacterium]MBK7268197.1 pyruvate kinase [Flavobacteriales bacterium]MBK9073489.1 pyruvate kinase [Flavobacteriales bacterium]